MDKTGQFRLFSYYPDKKNKSFMTKTRHLKKIFNQSLEYFDILESNRTS